MIVLTPAKLQTSRSSHQSYIQLVSKFCWNPTAKNNIRIIKRVKYCLICCETKCFTIQYTLHINRVPVFFFFSKIWRNEFFLHLTGLKSNKWQVAEIEKKNQKHLFKINSLIRYNQLLGHMSIWPKVTTKYKIWHILNNNLISHQNVTRNSWLHWGQMHTYVATPTRFHLQA